MLVIKLSFENVLLHFQIDINELYYTSEYQYKNQQNLFRHNDFRKSKYRS